MNEARSRGSGGMPPRPACGYSIHTSRKEILFQLVSETPCLSHRSLPELIQATLMTHIFRQADQEGRIKSVHTIGLDRATSTPRPRDSSPLSPEYWIPAFAWNDTPSMRSDAAPPTAVIARSSPTRFTHLFGASSREAWP